MTATRAHTALIPIRINSVSEVNSSNKQTTGSQSLRQDSSVLDGESKLTSTMHPVNFLRIYNYFYVETISYILKTWDYRTSIFLLKTSTPFGTKQLCLPLYQSYLVFSKNGWWLRTAHTLQLERKVAEGRNYSVCFFSALGWAHQRIQNKFPTNASGGLIMTILTALWNKVHLDNQKQNHQSKPDCIKCPWNPRRATEGRVEDVIPGPFGLFNLAQVDPPFPESRII